MELLAYFDSKKAHWIAFKEEYARIVKFIGSYKIHTREMQGFFAGWISTENCLQLVIGMVFLSRAVGLLVNTSNDRLRHLLHLLLLHFQLLG